MRGASRFYIDNPLHTESVVTLEDQVHHHLVHVLRAKPGAEIIMFDGRGGEYGATLVEVNRHFCRVSVHTFYDYDRESKLTTVLLQGICKTDRMDYVLQKAVEIGVFVIKPLICERSTKIGSVTHAQKKLAHWKNIIISASEQSGRTKIPRLENPVSFNSGINANTCKQGFVLNPDASRKMTDIQVNKRNALSILVGPEGGLSPLEISVAEHANFMGVKLGPRTLRTETAGVAALSIAQMLWGDW